MPEQCRISESERLLPGYTEILQGHYQAHIDSEEGTEAVALTRFMMMRGGGLRTVIFRADHPFLFAVIHRPTGVPLFLGRVVEPV